MMKLVLPLCLLMVLGCATKKEAKKSTPNIVIIYADDLGYGDVSCYNKQSKIATPNIDKLAKNGIMFTDAHSPSGICSPSRYGILTGRYSWRTSRKRGNPKPGEQPWINQGRITIASMLRDYGYNTAVIGKWGLGSDWKAAAKPTREGIDISANGIDYSKAIYSGKPVGFTHEEVHLWYGRNYYKRKYPCHDLPGTKEHSDGGRWYFENGISKNGNPQFDKFDMEEAQMHYIARSVDYINAASKNSKSPGYNLKEDTPFFLYYAPHIPHYPHVPAKQFQGTSGVGLYGDFVKELDWAVGEIITALEKNNILDETLIIFTSDNGPESQTFGYIQEYDHYAMKDFRGVKRDLWQGGHTIPFIVSYPNKTIKTGTESNRLISQTDILSTIADYLDIELDNNGAEDSYSFLDELIDGFEESNRREIAIHHSASGKLAIRQGDWVFINNKEGRDNEEPDWFKEKIGVKPHKEDFELFNLKKDSQQTTNLLKVYPEKAEELKKLLEKYIKEERTIVR
ncbi:arylsulfatase [Fulvivirga sp. M361]|uniref:sulfatase family protein n=1 Tax=Fulvivirga sp. M361 TaxID=2594266 RepID=UPI001179E555|nr:arylsulfatase [Fulvivirga sp. M361]TRX51907.1 arylsulfatase [Fulvivirga sp. M361]